jgi:hypothetical protein
MNIELVSKSGYDARGFMLYNPVNRSKHSKQDKQNKPRKPIDAVTFESFTQINENPSHEENYKWLHTFIKDMSDSTVNERIKEFRDSFDLVDDGIVEMLIMEEL